MALARAAGCADTGTPPDTVVRCLRDLPVATLVDAEFYGPPSYGNSVLPENPDEVLLSGRFHRQRYRHTDAVPHVQELGPGRAGPYDRSGEHQLRFWIDLG